MTGRPPDNHPALLDAWLDQRLGPVEQAAFEQRLAADPALREQVELQQQIDAGLRRRRPSARP